MPEVGEATTTQASGDPGGQSEERCSRKVSDNPRSSPTVDGVENQARRREDGDAVRETRDEKKARLQQLLEELGKEEEKLMKEDEELNREEEVRDLERQVEAVRKRIREREAETASKRARVASQGREKQPQSSPTAGSASTDHTHSGTGFDNSTSSISQTAAGHSPGCNVHAPSSDSVTSAEEVLAGSRHGRMAGTMSTDCVRKIETLKYYRDLDGGADAESCSLNDMDLDQLRRLAANGEDAERDIEQTKSIGHVYYSIFLKTGAIEDLERAIDRAKAQIPGNVDNPHHAPRLKELIVMLVKKCQHTKSPDDLQEAIFRAQEMMAATPPDHPDRSARMSDWIDMMFVKFGHTGLQDDLDEAIISAREAGAAVSVHESDGGKVKIGIPRPSPTPVHDPDRRVKFTETTAAMAAHQMAEMELFNVEAEMASALHDMSDEDLHSFAELHEDPASDDQIEVYICSYFLIFTRTRSMEHLEQAIQRTEGWIAELAMDHPDRARRFRILDMMSAWRSQLRLISEDVERMLSGNRISQASTYDEIDIQICRAARLAEKYERTGDISELEEAIRMTEEAINIVPKTSALSYLGTLLGTRFERTGSMDDVNRAVEAANMAVDAAPQDHPDRARWLSNLGNRLGTQFKRTGSMDDLNRAVDVAGMAVDAAPQDHPGRAGYLNNLGTWLGGRFERTGSIDDLNRAVDVAGMAVDATPQDHPRRAGFLSNLGIMLSRRFERTGSMDDLNRAVNIAGLAVDATPQDHPDRAAWLSNLGTTLGRRFERIGSMDDLNCALSSYKQGWRCRTAAPSIRIRLARAAADILVSQQNWEESSLLLQEAVNLLPTVSPRSLKHTDKQHMLADFGGLASLAAAAALKAGKDAYHALRLLELGRGVIAGLLMDMRGDISDLRRKHPSLADEFISLRDELDSPADSAAFPSSIDDASSWESQAKRRREADQKFSELVTRIRGQPGFHNFHLPPTADELMAAANPDPIIVVNPSSFRCDAFLVGHDRIRVLELPGLTLEDVERHAQELRSSRREVSFHATPLLEWLWDVVARPSLEALGFSDPVSDDNWPRLWWIPTGLLSQLPLHAAGRHVLGSTETVLDRAMSSYASSVKSLIHGRRHHVGKPAEPQADSALLVAMRETPDLSTNGILRFAADEVDMLKELCPRLQLEPITPQPRKDDVLKHLQTCKIFHFAGHGKSDPAEPSRSCLLLEDWKTNPLTVGHLRDSRPQENPPFLAYLSACSTGANEVVRLADEGIHLVNAFQLAGFRHVVGTLWEVSDKHCVDVARVLYKTMRDEGMTDVAVCRGLHRAVRELRDGQIGERHERTTNVVSVRTRPKGMTNPYWVPYVHFGV